MRGYLENLNKNLGGEKSEGGPKLILNVQQNLP